MRRMIVLLLVALVVPAIAVAAGQNFTAHLTGDEEVPPADTDATGQVKLKLAKDGEALSYKLITANIEDVTQAHIHMAPRGANGPVVVWLYPSGPPAELIPGRSDGVLASGTITEGDLVGPLAGQPVSALVGAIRAGDAYVNVHTSEFPGGEIRGQVEARGPRR